MKQAKHVQLNEGHFLRIQVCDLGGFLVTNDPPGGYSMGSLAAFTSAEECADWVRGFLRNATAKKFGPRKAQRS